MHQRINSKATKKKIGPKNYQPIAKEAPKLTNIDEKTENWSPTPAKTHHPNHIPP